MVFRLQCKCFYGTWPQCEIAAQECMDNAIRCLPPVDWAVVAREAHKDGTPHLHGIFYFKEKCDIKDANPILDMICMKHGNYQGAKSPKKVLRYVCKDNNYVTFGDVPSWKEEKVLDQIARELMAGKTYEDIKVSHPGIAPHAFAPQCQYQSRWSPSPLVFLPISTHFTATQEIPPPSTVL